MNLHHLRSPFAREKLREKMEKKHWTWISKYLHSLEMSLFVWPSGAPFFNCRAPFFRVAVSVGGSGPPFFWLKVLHSLDVTLPGYLRSPKESWAPTLLLNSKGDPCIIYRYIFTLYSNNFKIFHWFEMVWTCLNYARSLWVALLSQNQNTNLSDDPSSKGAAPVGLVLGRLGCLKNGPP